MQTRLRTDPGGATNDLLMHKKAARSFDLAVAKTCLAPRRGTAIARVVCAIRFING